MNIIIARICTCFWIPHCQGFRLPRPCDRAQMFNVQQTRPRCEESNPNSTGIERCGPAGGRTGSKAARMCHDDDHAGSRSGLVLSSCSHATAQTAQTNSCATAFGPVHRIHTPILANLRVPVGWDFTAT
ncbi:hypothetical protein V8D89_013326 [Ganoderma adspersum]